MKVRGESYEYGVAGARGSALARLSSLMSTLSVASVGSRLKWTRFLLTPWITSLTLRCAFNSSSNWFISDWIVNRGFKKNYYYNLPFNWRVTSPGSIPPSPSSSAATSLKTSAVENYFKIQSKPRSKPFFETQRHFFNMNAMDSTRVTLNHIIMFWLIIISAKTSRSYEWLLTISKKMAINTQRYLSFSHLPVLACWKNHSRKIILSDLIITGELFLEYGAPRVLGGDASGCWPPDLK